MGGKWVKGLNALIPKAGKVRELSRFMGRKEREERAGKKDDNKS